MNRICYFKFIKTINLVFGLICFLFIPVNSHSDIKDFKDSMVALATYNVEILTFAGDFGATVETSTGVDFEIAYRFRNRCFEISNILYNLMPFLLIDEVAKSEDTFKEQKAKETIRTAVKAGIKRNLERMETIISDINLDLNFAKNQNLVITGNQFKSKIREVISKVKDR